MSGMGDLAVTGASAVSSFPAGAAWELHNMAHLLRLRAARRAPGSHVPYLVRALGRFTLAGRSSSRPPYPCAAHSFIPLPKGIMDDASLRPRPGETTEQTINRVVAAVNENPRFPARWDKTEDGRTPMFPPSPPIVHLGSKPMFPAARRLLDLETARLKREVQALSNRDPGDESDHPDAA